MTASKTQRKIFNFNSNYRKRIKPKKSDKIETIEGFLERGGKIPQVPFSNPGFFSLPGEGGRNVFLQTE